MRLRQKERLLKLAAFLETVPARNFDLREITNLEDDPEKCVLLTRVREEHICGTTACAVGYLPVVFPKTFKYDMCAEPTYRASDLSWMDTWDIAEQYLGVTDDGFQYLFLLKSYHPSRRGPKSVAARIRKFVERNGFIPEYSVYS